MRPSILILAIDSLRADHVSCYGYERQTTPSIDRLASEGCVFEGAVTGAPCGAAFVADVDLIAHDAKRNLAVLRRRAQHRTADSS